MTFETFYNRNFRCSFYKETNNYLSKEKRLLISVLKEYAKNSNLASVLEIFSKKLPKLTQIDSADKVFVKREFINSAINMYNFLDSYDITNILDKYKYKNISGNIGCVIEDKQLNVQFSIKSSIRTNDILDFYNYNNYIYNKVKKTTNDCLVMSVPTNSFFKIEYKDSDYTIMMDPNEYSRRPSDQCITCANKCKPLFINGLERLKLSI